MFRRPRYLEDPYQSLTDLETLMRLLYVINGFVRGGAEMGLLHLLRQGFFDGTDAEIMAISGGNGALIADIGACGVPLHILNERPRMRLADMAGALPAVHRKLKQFKPDLMILSLPQANIVGRVAALFHPSVTVAAFEHSIHYSKAVYGPILKVLSGRVDIMFADTLQTARQVEQRFYRRPVAHKLVVPLASLPETAANVKEDYGLNRPVRLLSAGRLTAVKNQASLIDAVALLKQRGVEAAVTIFGEGEELDRLRDRARRRGVEAAVFLPGFKADWADEAADFDLFVLPSLREGLSIVTLEAMARGLPVIGVRAGGLLDYGLDGENAVLLNAVTPEVIADAVVRLVDDAALRERIGRAGVSTVAARFSESTVRAQLARLRKELEGIVRNRRY